MKILPRTQFGDPILRKKAEKVTESKIRDLKFQALIKQMFFTMRRSGGVGLAAPQIGIPLQLAVLRVNKTPIRPHVKSLPPTVIINPEIIKTTEETENDWEGCLSLPKVRGLVPRYKKIKVRYTDENSKTQIREFDGFIARVFQHEIDHLNGTVYVDRMEDMKTLMTFQEFKKRIAGKGLESR